MLELLYDKDAINHLSQNEVHEDQKLTCRSVGKKLFDELKNAITTAISLLYISEHMKWYMFLNTLTLSIKEELTKEA